MAGARKAATRHARSGIVEYLSSDIKTEVNEIKTTEGLIGDAVNPKLLSKSVTNIVAESITKQAKAIEYYDEYPGEDKVRSWVLLRYPKAEMKKEIARKKREQAQKVKKAEKLYQQARTDAGAKNAVAALPKLALAQDLLEKLPLLAIVDNSQIKFGLKEEIQDLYNSLIQNTSVTIAGDKQTGYDGEGLDDPLKMTFAYNNKPLNKMGVDFTFEQGKGVLSPQRAYSNKNGVAVCNVSRIDSVRAVNIIKATPFVKLEGTYKRVYLEPLAREFTFKSLSSGRNSLLIVVQEKELGKKQNRARSQHYLAEALIKAKYQVVDMAKISPSLSQRLLKAALRNNKKALQKLQKKVRAGILVLGDLETSFSSNNEGIICVKGTMAVKVLRLKTGKVIFQKELADVKGFQLSRQKASRKAVQKAAKQMAQELVAFLKTSQIPTTE
jgi:hypothetical protein